MCETSIPIRAGRVTNLSQPGTGQGERGNWTGSIVVVGKLPAPAQNVEHKIGAKRVE